jgi:hypothetical protein
MRNKLIIHIFCLTPEICGIISKFFSHNENYYINSTSLNNPECDSLDDIGYQPDCIILDSEINRSLKHKIYETFKNSKIIHLPSLTGFENDDIEDKGVVKVSEPLKLRELEEIIKNIYSTKYPDEVKI